MIKFKKEIYAVSRNYLTELCSLELKSSANYFPLVELIAATISKEG